MNTKCLRTGLTALVLAMAMGTAHAASVVDLVGDKDGLGLGLASGAGFDYELLGAGDGDGSDVGHDGNFTFVHDYDLSGSVLAASLELFTGGWGLGAPSSLYLNGSFVGTLSQGDASMADAPPYNYAWRDVFDLSSFAGLLTGHDTFEIRLADPEFDSGAFDYSQLTLRTGAVAPIPEPATVALFSLGLGAVAAARRRRRA